MRQSYRITVWSWANTQENTIITKFKSPVELEFIQGLFSKTKTINVCECEHD